MEEIRLTHARRPQVLSLYLSLTLSLLCWSLSLIPWCFGDAGIGGLAGFWIWFWVFVVLVWWFPAIGRLGFCCLGLMASELVFFLVWFSETGFLLFWFFESNVIRFFSFWVFVFLVWWVWIRLLGDCRSQPGCTPKIPYIYDIGRKKKRTNILFFLKKK